MLLPPHPLIRLSVHLLEFSWTSFYTIGSVKLWGNQYINFLYVHSRKKLICVSIQRLNCSIPVGTMLSSWMQLLIHSNPKGNFTVGTKRPLATTELTVKNPYDGHYYSRSLYLHVTAMFKFNALPAHLQGYRIMFYSHTMSHIQLGNRQFHYIVTVMFLRNFAIKKILLKKLYFVKKQFG